MSRTWTSAVEWLTTTEWAFFKSVGIYACMYVISTPNMEFELRIESPVLPAEPARAP